MADGDAPRRQPWPLGRFLKTAAFYSPLAKLTGASRPDPGAAVAARRAAAAAADASPASSVAAAATDGGGGGGSVANVVLVTGAAGGVGKRVVGRLLRTRPDLTVRALVRDGDVAAATWAGAGVDVDGAIAAGRLEVVVSDLWNLRAPFFDRLAAVVSATGTKVGPASGDTPSREKYYQGITFYPPVIVEATPQTVEYDGVKALADGLGQWVPPPAEEQLELLPVAGDAAAAVWGALDDVVMGGVSESEMRVGSADGGDALTFTGTVRVANSGGFASARTVGFETPANVGGYDGIVLRVRGDGNRYKFILRCDGKWDGISHCHSFDTVAGEWADVRIPFGAFNTVFRAKTLSDGAAVNPRRITAVQLMLSKFEYDGALNPAFTPGPFAMDVARIAAYRAAAPRPPVIHVGTGGTTRLLRRDEFPDLAAQPPAVRMNDALGRIMEWKLAGEDALRASGFPTLIVRPCALTEEPPRGYRGLAVGQGDNMTGKVSRDDVATVIVDALAAVGRRRRGGGGGGEGGGARGVASLTGGVTFELATVPEGTEGDVGSWEELLAKLEKDGETEGKRTYGPFPFVPQ
ncbi:hypothetical protein BU14_0704s0008 [Porphyra umbilicalis]|uniref:NADH:ubiquinone oxidoreductase intermediate-associated protein 30 domain-containing protein n=1 Tax=Porphyra umbilicalis TaxID=2786 RepID=A0A1X6NPW1_PORUM|nr:hypothetical protein BU14_0704s0008 [Porphyra umbilicalis]|eukprot:OSX70644.1 hypothetical protein BU14_0704s0008 [Porphyra umbilicalis]